MSVNPRIFRFVVALIAAPAIASVAFPPPEPAHAATVPAFSLPGLIAAADAVVVGTVVDNHPIWHAFPGQSDDIYTLTEVRITTPLKGAELAGATIFVMQKGGALDGRERTIPGTARFAPGDDVLLFTRSDGATHYLVGMGQGAFFLDRNRTTPNRWVRLATPTLLAPTPGLPLAAPAADTWLATALIDEVRRIVALQTRKVQP